MNVFLSVWLTIWTAGCVWLLHEYLIGGVMEDGDPIPLWFVTLFWAAEVFVACLLAYSLFCRTTIRMTRYELIIETTVVAVRWKRTIPRETIRRLVQVKDGGEDDDSFHSWGLTLEGSKMRKILRRLPYAHSHWLGQVLANWADAEFAECPPPNW